MSTNRINNILLEMAGPKFKGDAYHAPFHKLFDTTGKLLPYKPVGHIHDLCGGWIWITVAQHPNGKEVVRHVPENCSCCKMPLDGPKLAVEIQQCLNFDRLFLGPLDSHGNPSPAFEGLNFSDVFEPLGTSFLPPVQFDKKSLDEMRLEFEKSLEQLDHLLEITKPEDDE